MRDPLLIEAWGTAIPKDQRQTYQTINEKWDPCKSLTEAHDRIRKLTTVNNQIVGRLVKTQEKLDRAEAKVRHANLKVWVLSLVVSPLLGAGAKVLIDWAARVLAR